MNLRPLFPAEVIAARVAVLAAQIRADHGDAPIFVVSVLKGAFIFTADLVRALSPHELTIEFVAVRSYEGEHSTGQVELIMDVRRPLAGAHVLLVEDILDTGLTLNFLVGMLAARQPASLRTVVLLDKPSRRKRPFKADYVGFEVPDLFVVGYGLDADQRLRHLPFIGVVEPG